VIVVYVLGAWLGVALLLAWPVGALLSARLAPEHPATDEVPNRRRASVTHGAPQWPDVEVSAS
jgi:hypothetical protein